MRLLGTHALKHKGINPFTRQEEVFAAKPATFKIKVRSLKKLEDAAEARGRRATSTSDIAHRESR